MKTGRIGYIDARRIAGFTFPANATPGDGQIVDITDPSLGATGNVKGSELKFRPTGDKTGAPYVVARQITLYPQGDANWLSAHRIDVETPIGAPVMNTLWASDIYMHALAGALVDEYCGQSIGMNYTNAVQANGIACFQRFYTHGYVAMPYALYLAGAQATALFRLAQAMPPWISGAVGGDQLEKIQVNVAGNVRYIPLHTA